MRRANYTMEDRILLGSIIVFNKLAYIAGLWKAWQTLHQNLAIDLSFEPLLGRWLITDIIPYLHPFASCLVDEVCGLSATLSRLNVTTLRDFMEHWRRLLVAA